MDITAISAMKIFKGVLDNGLIKWDDGDIWTTTKKGIDRFNIFQKFYYKIRMLIFNPFNLNVIICDHFVLQESFELDVENGRP